MALFDYMVTVVTPQQQIQLFVEAQPDGITARQQAQLLAGNLGLKNVTLGAVNRIDAGSWLTEVA